MTFKETQIELYLSEIDNWQSGQKATIGMPSTGRNYALCMREEIKRLDKKVQRLRSEL